MSKHNNSAKKRRAQKRSKKASADKRAKAISSLNVNNGGNSQQEPEQKSAENNPPLNLETDTVGQFHKDEIQWLSSGWVQNITVGVILALIAPVVGIIVKDSKTIILGSALGLTAVVWFIAVLLLKSTPSEVVDVQPSQITPLEDSLQRQKASLDAQTDAARDSVRAWVGVTEIAQDIPFNDAKDSKVFIAVKNSGKVPAANVTGYIYVNYSLRFPPAPDEPVLGNADLNLFPKPLIMGGETRWVSSEMDFQKTKGWRDQGLVPYAYVIGFIWYEDKYGKHATKVCYFRKTDAPADVGFQPAPNNNWAN